MRNIDSGSKQTHTNQGGDCLACLIINMWCNNKLIYPTEKKCEKCECIIVYINVEYIKEMSSTKYKHN